jgi:LmbE family N-acetylglucosaminyl deacetylase
MKNRGVRIAALAAIAATVGWGPLIVRGQSGPGVPVAAAVEAINKARISTRILYITAHPDDEDAGLLAYLSRGLYADVAMLTLTRGQGGQNAIGPEQDGPLGVIRTTELLAAGSHYGVHQYFTTAVDTGFSKSPEWTMDIWGDNEPMADMVRVIRTYRPQVVINGWGGEHLGHGQHQTSGILTPRAVAAAADPTKFPEQIREGLSAWKVPLEVRPDSFPGPPSRGAAPPPPPPAVSLPTDEISPLWGISYVEMGAEGHGEHRSQGTPTLFGGGGVFGRRKSNLVIETESGAGGLFNPEHLNEAISLLPERFPSLRGMMASSLNAASQHISTASTQMLALDRTQAAVSLAEAGKLVSDLRDGLAGQNGDEPKLAAYELDQVRARIDHALSAVTSLSIAVNADRHELVAGENFSVSVSFPDKPAVNGLKYEASAATIQAPKGWNVSVASPQPPPAGAAAAFAASTGRQPAPVSRFNVSVPADASITVAQADKVLPFPPPLVMLALPVSLDDYTFTERRTIEFSETQTTGVMTYPLELVPAVTLTMEQPQVMVAEKHGSAPLDLFARVRYHGTKPAKVAVGLDTPSGWTMQPMAPIDFSAAGDQLVRFVLTPPAGVAAGAYPLHPFAKLGEATFRTSLEPIPTLATRDWSEPNDVTVHVADLNVPASLHVGYIAAADDLIPDDLRQIGIQVDLLNEAALAFGDLGHYDAIIVGLRGYELRGDVARANPRLLDYVRNGGTLVVQYQREPVWNKYKPAPYPASMPNTAGRTTNPNSPVEFLAQQNPLLNTPNKITLDDFKGWQQERGTYYWGTWDSQYVPILGLTDPNEKMESGALVYAKYGKGVYIYAGLVFFRELPAGVPGAYRLFVNLLSQTPQTKK